MASPQPFIPLARPADRWLLGIWLALLVYLIAPVVGVFHEGAHAIGYLLAGYRVQGIFFSPFICQVLGLYPPGVHPVQGWISAAGPLASLLVGYVVTWLYLRRHRSWGLWAESTALMVMWATLVGEPGYLLNGAFVHFGDPQQIAVHLGLPPWVVGALGLALLTANWPLIRRAVAGWADTFVLPAERRRLRPAFLVFIGAIAAISIPYWIPIFAYIGRSS